MAQQRLYALFQDVSDAERALGALADHGVSRDHMGVIARRPAEAEEAGRVHAQFTRVTNSENILESEPQVQYRAVPGAGQPPVVTSTLPPASDADTADNVEVVGKTGLTTTTPQDAAAGAAVGTGIGLVGGLLLAAAAITLPGVGLVLAGGALATAFGAAVGTAAAGAVAGGVTGYLRDMGMPEHAAQNIADRIHEGDYLVTAEIDPERYDDIKALLLKYNAVGVDINAVSPALGG